MDMAGHGDRPEGVRVTSRWVDEEAAAIADDVGLCAYASRLLGADPRSCWRVAATAR